MLAIPKLKSIHQLIAAILVLWVVTFYVHERALPAYMAARCSHGFNDEPDHTNVLIIADPQLIDNHTYPGRSTPLLRLSQHTADVYLKKNFRALMSKVKPRYVFFVGDYLDNGRSSTDDYFEHEVDRFNQIFPAAEYGLKKGVNFFTNVPGNHDIGIADKVKLPARQRFSNTFGKPNQIKTIEGVDFIAVDSLSLMAADDKINGDVRKFLDQNFPDTADEKTSPRVLLTHVPLFRDPEQKPCGLTRENDELRYTKGYQYQAMVDSDNSADLLRRISPNIVFSGDDHDYCDIYHNDKTREITVKSISMAMGIWYPGVQLFSFTNTPNFDYRTKLCYLPRPYANIVHYIGMAVVTGLALLWWNLHQKQRSNYTILPLQTLNSNSKKISNFLREQDEEDAESPSSAFSFLPNYTHTNSQPGNNHSKFSKLNLQTYFRKWKLSTFLRQCFAFAVVVTGIYYFGFCW